MPSTVLSGRDKPSQRREPKDHADLFIDDRNFGGFLGGGDLPGVVRAKEPPNLGSKSLWARLVELICAALAAVGLVLIFAFLDSIG